MEADEARRLKDLEIESARLEKLLAEAHLDLEALKVGFGVKRYPHRTGARPSPGYWSTHRSPSAGLRYSHRLLALSRPSAP